LEVTHAGFGRAGAAQFSQIGRPVMTRLIFSDRLDAACTELCFIRKTASVPQGVGVTVAAGGERSLVVQQGAVSICITLSDAEARLLADALEAGDA